VNGFAVARAAYGSALLVAPGPLLRLAGGNGSGNGGGVAVARILGGRHVAQALATAGHPGRLRLYAGAAVDGIHAASMLGLAALSAEERRPALIDATVAGTFCSLGLQAARSDSGTGRLAGR
jgi:hypothetical protein